MLLLSSLKGTLFLFWIVTSYLMCAQIKTEKNSPFRNVFGSMKKLEIEKNGQLHETEHSWGVQMEKVFPKKKGRKKKAKKWLHVRKMFT